MLRSYFNIAYRHLLKSKVFTCINVMGLTVGITAFLLIMQYASFEMSYDQFHENKDEIYRVALEFFENGELKSSTAKNYLEIGEMLKEHLPQMRSLTGFVKIPANTGFLFGYEDKIYNERGGFFQADSNFFAVFPSLLYRGNPKTALADGHNLVISQSIAKKIFGDSDPIGQRIDNLGENGDGEDFVISGILKDIPENAHFHANFVAVVNLEEWENLMSWQSFFYTYITLRPKTDLSDVNRSLDVLSKKLERAAPRTKGAKVVLQPIVDIHQHSHLNDELEAGGNWKLNYILVFIGLIILVIAWINYVNIETARFITRVREVGVRRIIGSSKGHIAVQFLVEYFLIMVTSALLSWLLLQLIFPYYSNFTGIPISRFQFLTLPIWLLAFSFFMIGSFLAGMYPAFVLLRLDPVSTLKGKISGIKRGTSLRKALLVVQFTSSISLIAFLLVIFQQVDFMRLSNKNIELGKVVALRNPTAYMNQDGDMKLEDYKTLENRLLQNPSIRGVATSSAIPGAEIGFTYVDLIKRNIGDPYDPTRYKTLFVDYNFITVYGLKLKAGRNYSDQNGDDEDWKTLILNERAIRTLGFRSAEEAVGQEVQFMAVEEWAKYRIVGVVEDYHHQSIKEHVYPTIFFLNHNVGQQVYYSIQLGAGASPHDALSYIEESWMEIFPEKPFEYIFVDDYYDQQFKSELYFGRIFTFFAGIAAFIACLGILGMTLFEANARLKEISIRKVLGASGASLIGLLSRDKILLVILSALIAMPLIYFSAREWLSTYPARIDMSAEFFLTPLLILISMVSFTSIFQTWKATNTNPVNHLKHE